MKRAFTLIELLVVVAIVAILAAIIFPMAVHMEGHRYRVTDPISHRVWIADRSPFFLADDNMYHFKDVETGQEIQLSGPIQAEELKNK